MIAESAKPLQSIETDFAVDSSGFSTTNYVRWFDVKYGNNEDLQNWVKLNLMCGVKTHVVISLEVSRATSPDSPHYKPLVDASAKVGFTMREISADKGYTSMKNLQATVDVGAVPFIPFKGKCDRIAEVIYGHGCSSIQLQARRIPDSLSQTIKRRNRVSDD